MSGSPPSTTATSFRPAVVQAAEAVGRLRGRIAAQHALGAPGFQTCGLATDLHDAIVADIWEACLADLPAREAALVRGHAALVAHGGYGRREMAPFSDVDLMVLHDGAAAEAVAVVAKRLVQDLFDAGLHVGQSVRTLNEAARLATGDATIFSSLLDARHLAGAEDLVPRLATELWGIVARGRRRIAALLVAAREEERAKFGGRVFVLEPNVKRSPGGLRDIQLARWLGLVRSGDRSWCGGAALNDVVLAGGIARSDAEALRDAAEFLLRLRTDLHVHAGKCADDLTRDEQVRIAAIRGLEERDGMLAVERFMRDYFHHTRRVAEVVDMLVDGSRRLHRLRHWFSQLLGHRVDRRYRVGPVTVGILPGHRVEAATRPLDVLRVLELSSLYDLPVDPDAWQAVRASASQLKAAIDAPARRRFLALLDRPTRLGESLRRLHEVGLLEVLVPAFAHARHLLQFNNYHKYTVDEHCIVAVDEAVALGADEGWLGDVWRQITRKRPLLLAILIHDLGKGFVEDHSEVGARIARDVAALFDLPADEAEIIEFLVHKHLVMAHLAFRRDVGDESIVARFARDVGSPEVLRMLTVLTAADVSAVGPGTWTRWKGDLLGTLYFRTLGCLDGETPPSNDTRMEAAIGRLPADGVFAAARWQPETATVAVTVATRESVARGIFHRLAGALASQRLEILAAHIHTHDDGLVVDHFVVHDPDFVGEPPSERLAEIAASVKAALKADAAPTFARLWNPFAPQVPAAAQMPPRVLVDNESSARSTIVEVFAHDSPGLLYAIARTLFEAGLSVRAAKIGTYADQVVDAFHITDRDGRKIDDPARLAGLRAALEKAAAPVTGPGRPG